VEEFRFLAYIPSCAEPTSGPRAAASSNHPVGSQESVFGAKDWPCAVEYRFTVRAFRRPFGADVSVSVHGDASRLINQAHNHTGESQGSQRDYRTLGKLEPADKSWAMRCRPRPRSSNVRGPTRQSARALASYEGSTWVIARGVRNATSKPIGVQPAPGRPRR
jgi:hypothetical protein